MKYLKLFESHTQSQKIEIINKMLLDWAVFDYLLKMKTEVIIDNLSYNYHKKFKTRSKGVLFTITRDNLPICSDTAVYYIYGNILKGDTQEEIYSFGKLFNKAVLKPLTRYANYYEFR